MCGLKKLGRTLNDPLGTLATSLAPTNDLIKGATPAQQVGRRIEGGESVSGNLLGDPAGFFTQTKAEKDAAAYAAAAPERAAASALTDANNSLAKLRSRRRQQGSTTTGAVSGGGQISSMMAYGKSTLGA